MKKNKIKINIIIFIIGVLSLSIFGGIIMAQGYEVGALVLVLGPVIMMLLLRFFAGDGFKNAGLNLNFKNKWGWYLASIFGPPVVILIVILLGVALGMTTINVEYSVLFPALFLGIATQFFPRLFFSLCEEFGWRGYLEPQLVKLGVPDIQRHLFVGFIWALWHFPLILATSYTEISLLIFLPLFLIGIMINAIVYGQVLKESGTVWTSVLIHGIANTVIWALIKEDYISFNNKLIAFPAPESAFMIMLVGLIGFFLYYKLHREQETINEG